MYFYEKGSRCVRNEIEWVGFKASGSVPLQTFNFTLLSELGNLDLTSMFIPHRVVST